MIHPRLRPTSIAPALLASLIHDGEIGYHGEQFGWVKMFRCSDLNVAECYQRGREELEQLRGGEIVTGSTHFGNFGERYPLDFEGAAVAGFTLWRNSYKHCGLTPMRPYRLPTAQGGRIAGLLGYLDAVHEDIAAADITSRPLRSAAEKAFAWLNIAGGGHLFLHSHAIQYNGLAPHRDLRSWLHSGAVMLMRRQITSGRARYRRGCHLIAATGLACLSHAQIARHRQRLDGIGLHAEPAGDRLIARIEGAFAGLTLATLDPRPMTVIDEEGCELPVAAERRGDWQHLTIIGTPAAPASAIGLAETVAAGAV